ncbi:MAG: PTS IIA-like nitrogen regulatory protein PtsN [Alphaproteobacteria bacterium]
MDIAEILKPERVLLDLPAASKKQVLEALAERAAVMTGEADRAIFTVLLERERLGSTGVGRGIAIPHGKLPGIEHLFGLLLRLQTPVPFDAVDDAPVDIVVLLLAPESAGADHLKALSRVSRILRDKAVCDRIRAAASPEEAMLAMQGAAAASHAA